MVKLVNEVDDIFTYINTNIENKYMYPFLKISFFNNYSNYLCKKDHYIFVTKDDLNEKICGIFIFLILPSEKYIELVSFISDALNSYNEMFSYLSNKFKNYQLDICYNPNNDLIIKTINNYNFSFDKEQLFMRLKNYTKSDKTLPKVILYNNTYYDRYLAIHNKDLYWTAKKVIDAADKFKIAIAINDENEVIGYIDYTYSYSENEPFDIYVKKEYRRMHYGEALLRKAIETCGNYSMVLHVDIDNYKAIKLYKKLGFVKEPNQNIVTAHIVFE